MRVFNQSKTKEIFEYDLELGYLTNDRLFIAHHEAVQAAEEQGHYEPVSAYDNGFSDLKWVVDVPAVDAHDAYDEYEDILVYIPYTAEELKKIADDKRHEELEQELAQIKEDIEQENFGIVRDDYSAKKQRAAKIINELRVLEGKIPRKTLII